MNIDKKIQDALNNYTKGELGETILTYGTNVIEFKTRLSKMNDKQFKDHLEIFKAEYKKRNNK
jgi:hypothetical protein